MEIPYFDNPGGLLSVTVRLQYAADVFLVDQKNYYAYQSGQSFRYTGGHYTSSPVTLRVNESGRHYLIVDDGGAGASYQYSWSK